MVGGKQTSGEFLKRLQQIINNPGLHNGSHGITVATAEHHPAFFQSIKELAEQSGIKMPHIAVVEHLPFGPEWTRTLPNAFAIPGPTNLMVTNSAVMRFTGADMSRPISPQLRSIMAHEFSHLKDGIGMTIFSRLMPTVLPIGAIIGLDLFDKAKAKSLAKQSATPDNYGSDIQKNIDVIADKEISDFNKETAVQDDAAIWHERLINAGRYISVAAIAWASGMMFARHVSLGAEYRADGHAVKMTRDPELMKQTLTNLQREVKAMHKSVYKKPQTFKDYIELIKHELDSIGPHAHPTMNQRFKHIDKVSKNLGIAPAGAAI